MKLKLLRETLINKIRNKISKGAYLPNVSMGYGFNASANFPNLTVDDELLDQLNVNKDINKHEYLN